MVQSGIAPGAGSHVRDVVALAGERDDHNVTRAHHDDPRAGRDHDVDEYDVYDDTGPTARATRGELDHDLKARLLDQSAVAGVGNLLGDEILFRAGIDPRTPIARLSGEQKSRLYRSFTQTMRSLTARGGSHLGDHMDARFPGGFCPKDGAPMRVATIGGRTTYWCSIHQV